MIIGKEGISAKIVADSINANNNRMTTYEIEFPRLILSELNTHRMESKNSASSRAIPVLKQLEQIENNPAMPVFWGKNQNGMQAVVELEGDALQQAKNIWIEASKDSIKWAKMAQYIDLHKQISNRILEPFQRMKTVISGTEWNNFFYLRDHSDAQPEIRELAKVMFMARNESVPNILVPGEWHLPYINSKKNFDTGEIIYSTEIESKLSLSDAKKISVSCCAQVSYRKNDDSLEKSYLMFDRLMNADVKHMSPFEHQATVMGPVFDTMNPYYWEQGVTHMDRSKRLWSGNLCGWIQFRHTIENESVSG